MPGLNIGVGGGLRVGPSLSSPAATVASTAYGAGSATESPSGVQPWHLGVTVGVAGLAWLVFLRFSLPG